jgi:hypothetical protein
MFAVIILGVGFIMIAALFPVAIRQSKSTADETSAAAFARVAANYFDTTAIDSNMPVSRFGAISGPMPAGIPQVWALPTRGSPTADVTRTKTLFESVRGNIISADDPRYAWVPFYFRATYPGTSAANTPPWPYAELILVCVQSTVSPIFSDKDVRPTATFSGTLSPRANLRGRPVNITIANSGNGDPDLIGFKDSTTGDSFAAVSYPPAPGSAVNAVAEGCFVIVRADSTNVYNGGAGLNWGRGTARIYRVGVRRPEYDNQNSLNDSYTSTGSTAKADFRQMQVWELMPGSDFTPEITDPLTGAPALEPLANCEAWVVGRSFADPNNGGAAFEGPAMDVAVYSTFVFVKPG